MVTAITSGPKSFGASLPGTGVPGKVSFKTLMLQIDHGQLANDWLCESCMMIWKFSTQGQQQEGSLATFDFSSPFRSQSYGRDDMELL